MVTKLRSNARPELVEIGQRLSEAVEKAGGKAVVAARIGKPRQTLDRWIAAQNSAPIDELIAVANVCGVSLDWLAGRRGGSGGFEEPGEAYKATPPSVDLVFVPALDAAASAGAGALNDEEPVTGQLAFRRDLLRGLGVSAPGALRVLEARGESMEPLIRAGDLLLVDTGIDRIEDEGVYVFRWNGALVVKRARIGRDTVELVSDNGGKVERIERQDLPGLHAAGRVVRVIRAL